MPHNSANVNTSKQGATHSIVVSPMERVSYACPKMRVNLAKVADEEEDLGGGKVMKMIMTRNMSMFYWCKESP